jgi:hypothetical protein
MNNLKKYAGLLNDAAPENHLLAYITPEERDMLVDAGGVKTPTPSGIFAYPPLGQPGTSPGTTTSGGSAFSGGGRGDSGDAREQYAVARTTTPIGKPVNVPSISPVERDTGLERIRQENIGLANQLTERPFEGVDTPFALANILGGLIGNFAYPINKDFFQENIAG